METLGVRSLWTRRVRAVTRLWHGEVLKSDQAHREIPFETICTHSPRKSPHMHMYKESWVSFVSELVRWRDMQRGATF